MTVIGEIVRRSKVNASMLSGILMLFAAGVLLLLSWQLLNAHDWRPVRVPFPLMAGSSAATHFTSDLNGDYTVQVAMTRNLPHDEPKQLEPPDIVCLVTASGKPVRFEHFPKRHYGEYGWSPTYWGEPWGAIIGKFDATAGTRYTLQARVTKAEPKLHGLDPHLEVLVEPVIHKEIAFKGSLLWWPAIVLLLIAVPRLLGEAYRSTRSRSHAEQRAMAPDAPDHRQGGCGDGQVTG